MIEYKTFPIAVKQVTDEGVYFGSLSVYNNVDLGSDIVRPGAFAKSINDRKGRIHMLWQHDPMLPIGVNLLTDTQYELQNEGHINLEKQLGREAYSDLKMWQKYGLKFGQSIGYETVKENFREDGVRELLEMNLWEGSLVTFPMNPLAGVSDVKRLARLSRSLHTDFKQGRTLSAATRSRLERALDEISTLLRLDSGEDPPEETNEGAVKPPDEPSDPTLAAELAKLDQIFGETTNVNSN